VPLIFDTEDYTCKIARILEDPVYRRLDKDLTEAVERKTIALISRSSLPKGVAELL
jgi:hypothetical protein